MDGAVDALAVWEQGISREKAGAMTDAIKYYRQALKIEPNIEKVYRKKLLDEYELSQRLKSLQLETQREVLDNVSNKNEPQAENVGEEDLVSELPCWLMEMLPDDLLARIVDQVVYNSGDDWVNLSLTCQKFNALCFFEVSPYRTFARFIYQKQVYDAETLHEKPIDLRWDQNYRLLLRERPYIKFNGVYISVVNYLRYGAVPEGSSSFLNPIHMITYYRYFRFYPDGRCLRLLSTDEPNHVIPAFSIDVCPPVRDAELCRWHISPEHPQRLLTVSRIRSKDMLQFREQLQIVNRGHRPFNKLKWISSSAQKADGTTMEFGLAKEKPFIFSRVRSYYD